MAAAEGIKILTDNRKARYNYHLLERFEVGMALTGSEVKSARDGKLHLTDAYASIRDNELWLFNAHISPYDPPNRANHDPTRTRKLLAHRGEINRLIGKTRERGLTLVPTRIYLKKGRIKCELALARGKLQHDKRETLRRKTAEAEAREAMQGHR